MVARSKRLQDHNRGEGYHQLTGKIIRINDGKFRGTTELELAIWNECIRFIANCIILYNAVLLSKLYEAHEKLGNAPEILGPFKGEVQHR